MHPELAGARVVREHFRRVVGRDRDRFLGHQDIKLVRVERQRGLLVNAQRLPEIQRIVVAPIQIDALGVFLGAPADERVVGAGAAQVHGERQDPRPVARLGRRRRVAADDEPSSNSSFHSATVIGRGASTDAAAKLSWFRRVPVRTTTLKLRGAISM